VSICEKADLIHIPETRPLGRVGSDQVSRWIRLGPTELFEDMVPTRQPDGARIIDPEGFICNTIFDPHIEWICASASRFEVLPTVQEFGGRVFRYYWVREAERYFLRNANRKSLFPCVYYLLVATHRL